MLSCSEQGVWPDELSDSLNGSALDALVEHAAGCLYHQQLLDQDEEEFLAELRQTAGILCSDAIASTGLNGAQRNRPQESTSPRRVDNFHQRQPAAVGNTGDELYNRYRRWSDERCPLEILQVRCGGRNVWTFDVLRDGGSWRLSVERGDAVLQFWSICLKHHDQVMLAAYPLPRPSFEQAEVSTITFVNGQSLSVLVTAKDGNKFDVRLHCTAPRTIGARYTVYTLGSIIADRCLQASQLEHCKVPQALEDFAKLSEFRFPVRDLEAARLPVGLHKEKYVHELLRAVDDEYPHAEETFRPCNTPATEDMSLNTQEGESRRSAQIASMLKKWVESRGVKHTYRPSYRKVTENTCERFHPVEKGRWSETPRYFVRQHKIFLFIGGSWTPIRGSFSGFCSSKQGVDYNQEIVSYTRRKNPISFSEIFEKTKDYHCCRSRDSCGGFRLLVPLGVGKREQFLSHYVWSTSLQGAGAAERWAIFEANLLTLLEKFFVDFVEAGASGTKPFRDWEESAGTSREMICAGDGLARVCESCTPRDLCRGLRSKMAEALFGNGATDAWTWLSRGRDVGVISARAPILPTRAVADSNVEYHEENRLRLSLGVEHVINIVGYSFHKYHELALSVRENAKHKENV